MGGVLHAEKATPTPPMPHCSMQWPVLPTNSPMVKGTVAHGMGSGVRAGGEVHWQVLSHEHLQQKDNVQQQQQSQQQQQVNGHHQVLQNLQGMPCHAGHSFSVGTGQGCRGAACPSHSPIRGNLHRQDGYFGLQLQNSQKKLQTQKAYETRGFRAYCTVQGQDNLGKVGKVGELSVRLCTAPLRWCDNNLQRSSVRLIESRHQPLGQASKGRSDQGRTVHCTSASATRSTASATPMQALQGFGL